MQAPSFPAATVLKSDFYVDDLLTGADTVEEATLVRDQLIELTKMGGFELRQWSSNNVKLLQSVTAYNESDCTNIIADEFRKTLGLYWSQVHDTLGYTVKRHEPLRQVTKRAILSRVAQLFDPLGLLGPIIVKAKILMQKLWQVGVNWDESIPETLHTEWKVFESQLKNIRELSIPRRIICDKHIELELHGFCDASEKAYEACIYMRSTNTSGHHFAYLVCSKSRVAPLKVQSLPRLELCAAVLLAKLFSAAEKSLKIRTKQKIFWTDSMIVLHCLKTPPHTLKVFVANRVSEIQQSTDGGQWRHVPSQDNPADCLSRGVEPSELRYNNNWFSGPQWLRQAEDKWPFNALLPAELPERRTVVSLATAAPTIPIINRFSALGRLERTIAYCLRFHHILKTKQRQTGPLSLDELKLARQRILKSVQQTEFADDIKSLIKTPHSYKGKLRTLNPFLDEKGILCVGGSHHQIRCYVRCKAPNPHTGKTPSHGPDHSPRAPAAHPCKRLRHLKRGSAELLAN
ncbi:uncharacterized protein LOC122404025 [Colletes gigas]|uniref:uncharacterized protein LOC122404025 n=1 Tax=Colletes gigas TaxID=935657 RepID=UPI001C9BA96B|nr:uncharacterized protein LOC122404025 [Colletes gigas]